MSEYDKLCEKYMIRRVRSFYPRKFDLSPEFVEAFKLEYSRLVESGQNKRTLFERIRKALTFHL
jgi:hypothetical protein|tara:strand:- start:8 stop:199 length:192 start_codon:yes stop_codon:yes gene_type:complete